MEVLSVIAFGVFWLAFLFFIGWLIVYPIYRKITDQSVLVGSYYPIGLMAGAGIMIICRMIIRIASM